MFAGRTDGADDCVYLAVNTYWEPLHLNLPKLPLGKEWFLEADTFEEDSVMQKPLQVGEHMVIRERSVMVFKAGSIYE